MSDLRKEALQALEDGEIYDHFGARWGEKRIEALRAALAQPEPVCDKDPRGCWNVRCQLGKVCKNTPPQRKPLTDQEIIEAIKYISHNEMSAFAIARAIENVLKNAPSEANKGTYDNP